MHPAFLLCFFLFSNIIAETYSLDGPWQFVIDHEGKLTIRDLGSVKKWREIRVPYSWNSQFSDLRDYRGIAWYRKTVELPPIKSDQTVLIKFAAVDYFAEIFVNGKKAGEHEGGYLPFSFEIGNLIRTGSNDIAVRVIDPDDDKARWGNMNYNELPHGKQSWYVQTGGIWQSVTLQICPKNRIEKVFVTAKTDGKIEVLIATHGPAKENLSAKVIDPSGKIFELTNVGDVRTFRGEISEPSLWSPDHPNLYTIEVKYGDDQYTDHFGFRSFETRNGKFYLNGEPIYIISALDQDFYPEGIYTPPSYEFLVDEMKKAKQLGLNMLRTHIKVPTPDYLRAADEVGVLIWYEIPSWEENTWTPAAAKRGEEIFLGEIERDWNHPSVVIQTIINESWGVRQLKEKQTRRWLKEAFNKLAPQAAKAGRLTVDNSACCGNFHLKSDIADYHRYNSIPDYRRDWNQWVAEYASRPSYIWSNHGDAEFSGKEPLLVSEFGNWGLPLPPQKMPWWFDRDFNGREVTRAGRFLDRFHLYKFDQLFSGIDELVRATQRHQWISFKHEIEEMRKYASIQGYTITEFTDLNWECNGLLDMFRNKKIYADDLAKIQQQDSIFARTLAYNYISGEKIELTIYVSHYSNADPQKIRCYLDDKVIGEVPVRNVERASVLKDESIAITAPAVTKPTAIRLRLQLQDENNSIIAENYHELFIYPEPHEQTGKLFLQPNLSVLGKRLNENGYKVVSKPDQQSLIITEKLNQEILNLIRAGHRAIVLVNDKAAIPEKMPIRIFTRDSESGYDGNWVSNFNWVNLNRPPFREVAFETLLGFEADEVIPHFVIEGVKPADYDDVMSGMFLGWINKNVALMLGAKIGEGAALITTYRLTDTYGRDEYARHLLDAMIKLVLSPDFESKLRLRWT